MSLYDYLGKPAGPQLGKEVNLKAQANNIPIQMKDVSNSKYTGKVLMYPKHFLDLYFGVQQTNDLPF